MSHVLQKSVSDFPFYISGNTIPLKERFVVLKSYDLFTI